MDYLKAYPALEGLVDLANRDDIDISVTLLRVLTDLYVTKPAHSGEEERQYTELALRLLDAVDAQARQQLAQRLASYVATPLPVVRRLARDVIAVAEPILLHTQSLPVAELFAIAKTISPSHVAAIAARDAMKSPAPSESSAPSAPPIAGSRAMGNDLSHLSELFFAANPAERRLILLNLDYAPLPPPRPIVPQLANEANRRLEAAALSHNGEVFVRELARALAIPVDRARRLTNDQSGEPLVVAAKALGMPADALQRILLCLNPAIGQSVQRVYALSDLYEEIKADAALRMAAIWQTTAQQTGDKPKAPVHQPQYVEDSSPRPRRDAPAWDRRAPQSKPVDRRTGSKRDW